MKALNKLFCDALIYLVALVGGLLPLAAGSWLGGSGAGWIVNLLKENAVPRTLGLIACAVFTIVGFADFIERLAPKDKVDDAIVSLGAANLVACFVTTVAWLYCSKFEFAVVGYLTAFGLAPIGFLVSRVIFRGTSTSINWATWVVLALWLSGMVLAGWFLMPAVNAKFS